MEIKDENQIVKDAIEKAETAINHVVGENQITEQNNNLENEQEVIVQNENTVENKAEDNNLVLNEDDDFKLTAYDDSIINFNNDDLLQQLRDKPIVFDKENMNEPLPFSAYYCLNKKTFTNQLPVGVFSRNIAGDILNENREPQAFSRKMGYLVLYASIANNLKKMVDVRDKLREALESNPDIELSKSQYVQLLAVNVKFGLSGTNNDLTQFVKNKEVLDKSMTASELASTFHKLDKKLLIRTSTYQKTGRVTRKNQGLYSHELPLFDNDNKPVDVLVQDDNIPVNPVNNDDSVQVQRESVAEKMERETQLTLERNLEKVEKILEGGLDKGAYHEIVNIMNQLTPKDIPTFAESAFKKMYESSKTSDELLYSLSFIRSLGLSSKIYENDYKNKNPNSNVDAVVLALDLKYSDKTLSYDEFEQHPSVVRYNMLLNNNYETMKLFMIIKDKNKLEKIHKAYVDYHAIDLYLDNDTLIHDSDNSFDRALPNKRVISNKVYDILDRELSDDLIDKLTNRILDKLVDYDDLGADERQELKSLFAAQNHNPLFLDNIKETLMLLDEDPTATQFVIKSVVDTSLRTDDIETINYMLAHVQTEVASDSETYLSFAQDIYHQVIDKYKNNVKLQELNITEDDMNHLDLKINKTIQKSLGFTMK